MKLRSAFSSTIYRHRVMTKQAVYTQNCQMLNESLCHNQPIKRVFVVERELLQCENVGQFDGQ